MRSCAKRGWPCDAARARLACGAHLVKAVVTADWRNVRMQLVHVKVQRVLQRSGRRG